MAARLDAGAPVTAQAIGGAPYPTKISPFPRNIHGLMDAICHADFYRRRATKLNGNQRPGLCIAQKPENY
jgi:hypothetical protein